ncbi:hypothetical protein Mal4_23920 [Maioricimonas rarisocia]|uniref:Uncharacterized protein n=1 Tax=Maioricimonas rarisocia TaxID=2528026 RepID=A0A517Z6F7_9PLAN|nr:hypothetical protein [Maioricimonas rarisocia]QDU38072.1 hypothetical protein Mal4_23920 [Maioricimonas rarisocia]
MKAGYLSLATALLMLAPTVRADDQPITPADDTELARDLELLQGKWEMRHGMDATGKPTILSIRTITDNTETVERFDIRTGEVKHRHTVQFQLSKSGNVRVFTFFVVGANPSRGASAVYKVDKENLWDVPGLLQGGDYRNYQSRPTLWHWKRVAGPAGDSD